MKPRTISRRRFLQDAGSLAGAASLGGAALGGSLLPSAAAAQDTEIEEIDLGYATVLQGAGCNVVTIPGQNENGALMIDGGLAAHSAALLDAVFQVTGQARVHTLLNTHWHPEQTGSNETVGADGAVIFAHETTQMYLGSAVMSTLFEGRYGPLAPHGIPNRTTRGDGTMTFAGQVIRYGYLPAAHTNGDLYFYFPLLNLLVAGGPVTAGQWPVLDIRNGAWIGGLVRAYETLSAIITPDTRVVPAHGPMLRGADVLRMRGLYTDLHLHLVEEINKGTGADDIVVQNPLAAHEDEFGDASAFLDGAHRSLYLAYVPD